MSWDGEDGGCSCGVGRRHVLTLGHVGKLVLAHGFEGRSLELSLGFRWDAKEVDGEGCDGEDAGDDGEEANGGHDEGMNG